MPVQLRIAELDFGRPVEGDLFLGAFAAGVRRSVLDCVCIPVEPKLRGGALFITRTALGHTRCGIECETYVVMFSAMLVIPCTSVVYFILLCAHFHGIAEGRG